jgi:hypothetical protein
MRADELMRQLESDPDYQAGVMRREAALSARRREFLAAAEPLLRDLEAAGINTEDFGRFVNRVVPGVLEPSSFDERAATPILIKWLPRMADSRVKQTIVRHLKNKAAKGVAFEVLMSEFCSAGAADDYRWVVGDALSYVASREDLPRVASLAMGHGFGTARQLLVDQLWRLKTSEVQAFLEHAISDPTIARAAGSALRRLAGNDEAEQLLRGQLDAHDERVAAAARDHLKRIERARAKRN